MRGLDNMKPAHRTCVTCHKEFLFSNKSYRRSCVSSLIGGERIADILFAKYSFLIADRTSYICISCRGYLVNLLRYEKKVMQRIGMKAAEDTRTVLQEEEDKQHWLRNVTFYHALLFLEDVILKYWENPDIVVRLLEILSKWRVRVIDTKCVKSQVKELFDSDEDMLLGFNVFLPTIYQYRPDPDKIQENNKKNTLSGKKLRGSEKITDTENSVKETQNDNQSENLENEKENQSENVRKKKHYKKSKKFGSWMKNRKRNKKDNSEMKQVDDSVEDMDDTTLQIILNNDKKASQDMYSEKQVSAENSRTQSLTMLVDSGTEITVLENVVDNSEMESDTENWEHGDQSQSWLDEEAKTLQNVEKSQEHYDKIATSGKVYKDTDNENSVEDVLNERKKTDGWQKETDQQNQRLQVKPEVIYFPIIGKTLSEQETELQSENSQANLWTLNLHNKTGNQSPDVVKGYQLQEANSVTNQEVVKKVLTHEATSENSSERRTIDSKPGSKLRAEGLQNENKAAGFESEDKNKALDFEILEREFEVKLKKPRGRDLGFTLTHGPSGEGFYIHEIYASPALTPPRKLQSGDRILMINNVIVGCTDQSSVEKFILKQDGLVSIRVRRFWNAVKSSAYCERKVSNSELVKLRESKHLETVILNATSQSSGMPLLDVGSNRPPPQLLIPVTKPPEGPLLVPLMQTPVKPLLVPISYLSTTPLLVPATMSSTMSLTQSTSTLTQSTSTLTQSTKTLLGTQSSSTSTLTQSTKMLLVTQTSSASLTQSSIMSYPSTAPLLVPVTMSSTVSLAQSTSTSLVAPGFQPSLMKLPLLNPTSNRQEIPLAKPSMTPLSNSEFSFSKTSSVIAVSQASKSTTTVSSSKLSETSIFKLVSKTSEASVLTSASGGSETPLNTQMSKLTETQALNPVLKSSVMKLPIQLSDASKRQLLESLSKSGDNEAIIMGQKGIIKLRKLGKPKQEVAHKESGHESSQKQTKEFESASSLLVSPELVQVSDSEQTLSKTTTTNAKERPLLCITQSVMKETTLANMTQNKKDVPVSSMKGRPLSNVIQAGIKEGPVLNTIQTFMKESPLLNTIPSNMAVEQASNARQTVIKDYLLPTATQSLVKGKPILNIFQTDTKEGPSQSLVKSGPFSNNTQSIVKERPLSEMIQSVEKARSLLTTTPSVMKNSSTSYNIQTGVKQKPKSHTTQTVMKEPKPVDATHTVVEEISTPSLANVAENTRKTLLKAALDLVKKTKYSNPELQNFKLSFIKTDDLDKESLQNVRDTVTVKLKDTEQPNIYECSYSAKISPAEETGEQKNETAQSSSTTKAQDGNTTQSSGTTKAQDDNSTQTTNRTITEDDYNYFLYVKTKKEKPTPRFKGVGKKKFQKLKAKSTLRKNILDRVVETNGPSSAKAKVVPGNKVAEAENETVMESSIAQSGASDGTHFAESDNEFDGADVPLDPDKPHNIIELDHPYTTCVVVANPDNLGSETHTSPRPNTSAVVQPKVEKVDADSPVSPSPGMSGVVETIPGMSDVAEAARGLSGVAEATSGDSEMPMSPRPSTDFLQAIQMTKIEISDIDSADVAGDSGQPVNNTDDAKPGPAQSEYKHQTAKNKQVLKPKRTSMRLTNKAQRRKLKLMEGDNDPVPAKKPKYRVVRPVKKQPAPANPEDCCVHCFRSFLLNKSTRISVKEYLNKDNGKDQVLLGTFLKYEVGVGHINPEWCICQMCYIVCEKIQRWREQFVGSKENLENAQTEFQKRKNCLALLYNKSSHGQTHEWRKEGAVMSVRTNDNDNEEVEKQRKITMITKKIWSEVELSNRNSFTEKCVKAVRGCHYETLLRHLVGHGKTAKASLLTVVKSVIRKEVNEYINSHCGTSVLECNNFADIERFNWIAVMDEFSTLPFLSGVLKAMLTKSDRQKYEEKCFPRNPDTVQREFGIAFGVLVSVLFFFRNRRYNMFQTINSLQMYEKNCTKQLFALFWNVGFCCREKSQIRGIVTKWTSDKLGTLGNSMQLKVEGVTLSYPAEEEMEVPYRYDKDDDNENEQTSDALEQDGQLRENRQSEHMAEETANNEELRHALGTIESFERMAQGDTQGNVDMEGDNQVYYVAEETGQYVPDYEHYSIEVEEVEDTDVTSTDDKTESVVTEVRESQADNVEDIDNVAETEVTVEVKSIRDDGTIEINYDGQEDTELRTLDEWMKIFASKS